jgi:NAD(P)-dependent dehydrogenase (short-subunit alcohol dehydrogenase family)
MDWSSAVALVTGANKGIGKETARGLARLGMTVLLGARDAKRGAAAANELRGDGRVSALTLDVTNRTSIAKAASEIQDYYGRLDILINNAGVPAPRVSPSEVDAASMRAVFETNVFGVVEVMHAMLPLLRKSAAARVVNISSLRGSLGDEGAFVGRPSMPYSTSKTTLNAITVHYARELCSIGIKVNAAAPGHVATDFNNFTGTRSPTEGAAVAIKLATLGPDGPTGTFLDDKGRIAW